MLEDLAAHPATARHLATKLARHFAGDEPPPAMVERLSQAWLRSGGDLPTVYRALIDSPEAWAPPPAKFQTPWEWSIAALRAVGARQLEGAAAGGLLAQLGQPVWRPGSPAGYDDVAASWTGPDALMRRVEAAERIAARAGELVDARALAPRLLPGTLSDGHRAGHRPRREPGARASPCCWSRPSSCGGERCSIAGPSSAPARRPPPLLLAAPHLALAQAATERRFVFIIQRGAADGLATVAPTGDPDFARVRGAFAQDVAGGARLGDFFTLHPGAGRDRATVRGARGAVRPCRRLALSRPLALRRPERARDRRQRRLRAARRLDEPPARPAAARRRPGDRRLGDGADGAARRRARSPPTRLRRCPTRRTTCSPGSPRSTNRIAAAARGLDAGDADAGDGRRPQRRRRRRTPPRPARSRRGCSGRRARGSP